MSSTFIEGLSQMLLSEFPIILSLIFGGCCSNAFALEVLVTDSPKSGQLITFGQFVFIALDGLRHQLTWGKFGPKLKPSVVPLYQWFFLVVMFFIVSILNNLALGFNISMPLHIIFRSGGLIVNMILGAIILKKRYSMGQIVGVVFVTAGVIWATLDNASANTKNDPASTSDFIFGITLLVIAMVLQAGMGLFQEVTYKKYGKQWREGLFYTHFLALPFFLFFYKDLYRDIKSYNNSPLLPIPVLMDQVPVFKQVVQLLPNSLLSILSNVEMRKLWGFLLLNIFTQYACIAGVNRMTSVATSLTLNLVLNLRKYMSLIFSILYFNNHFGVGAMAGTALVVCGTAIYTRAGLKGNTTQKPQPQKKQGPKSKKI